MRAWEEWAQQQQQPVEKLEHVAVVEVVACSQPLGQPERQVPTEEHAPVAAPVGMATVEAAQWVAVASRSSFHGASDARAKPMAARLCWLLVVVPIRQQAAQLQLPPAAPTPCAGMLLLASTW